MGICDQKPFCIEKKENMCVCCQSVGGEHRGVSTGLKQNDKNIPHGGAKDDFRKVRVRSSWRDEHTLTKKHRLK